MQRKTNLRVRIICLSLIISTLLSFQSVWAVAPLSSAAWYFACPDTYPTRLQIGMRATVTWTPPLPNRVRSQPYKAPGNVIGRLPPGVGMEILHGPACANGWVWWYVRGDNHILGWTSEGEPGAYWLEPQQNKPWPPHPSPSPAPQPVCMAEYPTRLRVGDSARLTDNAPNSLRIHPTIYAQRLGYLLPQELSQVIAGPVCANGWIWWYVHTSSGYEGWTSEGGFGAYWLAPEHSPIAGDTCPASTSPGLAPGVVVTVAAHPGAALFNEPNARYGQPLGFFAPNETATILAPAACIHGVLWWQIQTRFISGWVQDATVRLTPDQAQWPHR